MVLTGTPERSAPLPLSPDAPVRPVRARRDTDPPRRARLAVAARSGGWCEKCRKAPAVRVHRRQPGIHALPNLLHLCPACDEQVHAAPAESHAGGWLVRPGDDAA